MTFLPLARALPRAISVAGALLMLAAAGLQQAVAAAELVMFDSPSCVWCRRWDREVAAAYAASDEGRIAPLRRIDITRWNQSGVRLARPVATTPTFVLAADGAEIGRITGYPGADFFWGELGHLLARIEPPRQPREPERSAALGAD